MFRRLEVQAVGNHILMHRADHHPRLLLSACAGRHDCLDKVVETRLHNCRTGVFLTLLEHINIIFHLLQVKRIVGERELRIFDYRVALRRSVVLLIVERLYLF